MAKVDQLLGWAKNHRGSLKAIPRKRGVAYLFRYCRGSVVNSINFPAGLDSEVIKSKILEIERAVLLEKVGIGQGPAMQHRQRHRLTLKEFTEWYLKVALSEKLAIRTVEGREFALRDFMNWLGDYYKTNGENFKVDDVTREVLNEFKRHLLESNSANGAAALLGKIRTAFKKGHYESVVANYPFVGFQYPRSEPSRERPLLTLPEMREISGMFSVPQTRLAWDIARLAGIRGNDILGLRSEDIDYEKRLIRFESKKLHRREILPVHPKLMEILKPYQGRSGNLFSYASKRGDVFSKMFSATIQKLKGKDFKPVGSHTPRHSLGAYLRNVAKWQWPDIQMFLCHHSSRVVTLRYTHDDIENLRALIEQLPLDGA